MSDAMPHRRDRLYGPVVVSLLLDLLLAAAITAWYTWQFEHSGEFRLGKRRRVYALRWHDAVIVFVPLLVVWAPLCWLAVKARLGEVVGRRGVAIVAALLKFFAAVAVCGSVVGLHVAESDRARPRLWLPVAAWAVAGGIVSAAYLVRTRGYEPRLSQLFRARITR